MRLAAPSTLKIFRGFFNIEEVDICSYKVIILEAFVFRQSTLKMIPALGKYPVGVRFHNLQNLVDLSSLNDLKCES